jgi:hypothetical protein
VSKSWAEEQAATIGTAVRDLRGKRTGQWLSDETERVGHRVPRTTISELESGKRKSVSTAELCLLAWALKVPPIRLLYPDLPDGPVEIIPGKKVPSIDAATWFSGELTYLPKLTARSEAASDEQWLRDAAETLEINEGAHLVHLARERREQETRISTLARLITRLRASSEDPSLADQFVKEIAAAEARIKAINAQLRRIDGAVLADGG